jgi:predicted transcriptional regulator
MGKKHSSSDKKLESAIRDILRSQAQSRIYIFLLRKKSAKTEDIIKGTHLHPSTVRETLSKMFAADIIFRKKIKTETIGKNPFMYSPLPPLELLKRYASDIEDRLNKIARLSRSPSTKDASFRPVKINIEEQEDSL